MDYNRGRQSIRRCMEAKFEEQVSDDPEAVFDGCL